MKILITGGLGYIGSHLIKSLPLDYELTVIDDLSTQRYCSLFNVGRKIKFIECAVKDIDSSILNGTDVVIHLAAIVDAVKSFSIQEEIEAVNFKQTEYLLDLCEKNNIQRFIFPSTTSVYGVASDTVHEDDDAFLNPQSPYAESKVKEEKMVREKLSGKTNFLIFRFGTVFGTSTGIRFHTAINKFCYQASVGQPLTVWKQNHDQVRPYLGLNDLSKCVQHFINSDDTVWNTLYNVVTVNIKLSEIINSLEQIVDNVQVSFVDTPLLNQYSYDVSTTKIEATGFKATDDLQKGIQETIHLLKGLK